MPHGRKCKYGGWNLSRGIICSLLVVVKVYVNEVDGTSATVAETCHAVGSTITVAVTRHTIGNTSTVAETFQTVGSITTVATICHTG